MNVVTFLGLSDAGMQIWLCAMGLWTIIQSMVNAAQYPDDK